VRERPLVRSDRECDALERDDGDITHVTPGVFEPQRFNIPVLAFA